MRSWFNAVSSCSKTNRRHNLWLKQGCRCCWCNKSIPLRYATIEHLIPKRFGFGGQYTAVSCFSCNSIRGGDVEPPNWHVAEFALGLYCEALEHIVAAYNREKLYKPGLQLEIDRFAAILDRIGRCSVVDSGVSYAHRT